MNLLLPATLQSQIAQLANAAFPKECCGMIEGVIADNGFRATALHPARNLANAPDRFEIDPADHFQAVKAARRSGHDLIGCYHSHPDGKALPSQSDRDGGGQENFLWLIAATDGAQCRLAAFVYRSPGFEEVGLRCAMGADLVTSSL